MEDLFYILPYIVGFFGLFIGSFLNVVVLRHEKIKDIVFGRSQCMSCNHTLSWDCLVPVFSFLFLMGKCKYCKSKISWQYLIVEILTGFLFYFTTRFLLMSDISNSDFIFYLIVFLLVSVGSVLLSVFDCKYSILPDLVTIPMISLAILFHVLMYYLNSKTGILLDGILYVGTFIASFILIAKSDYYKNIFQKILTYIGFLLPLFVSVFVENENLSLSLIGGTLSLFFALQFFLSKGKIIGGGDIRLGAFIGIFLGWKLGLLALFIGYFLASFVGVFMMFKYGRGKMIVLGPFLCLGFFISLFYGSEILNFYFALI